MPIPVEIAPFAGVLNAGQVLGACFEADVDLVLHGHVHKPWFSEQR
jgi:predicted phosphodiesterase